jgi:hypothetical protein
MSCRPSRGKPVEPNIEAYRDSAGAGNTRPISPGKSRTYTVRLDEFFFLKEKGKHEVTVKYWGRLTPENIVVQKATGVDGVDFVSARTAFEIR